MDLKDLTNDYVCILAKEDGVNIIGPTWGGTQNSIIQKSFDRGEVMIAQFTENTSAIKIRGKAVIYTKHGVINSGEKY